MSNYYDNYFRTMQCFELGWDDKELDEYRQDLWEKGLNYTEERFTVMPENKDYIGVKLL